MHDEDHGVMAVDALLPEKGRKLRDRRLKGRRPIQPHQDSTLAPRELLDIHTEGDFEDKGQPAPIHALDLLVTHALGRDMEGSYKVVSQMRLSQYAQSRGLHGAGLLLHSRQQEPRLLRVNIAP